MAQAVAATAASGCGLCFFRLWRVESRCTVSYFGAAFWLLALSRALLAFFNPAAETRPYVYGVRLIAFLLIVVAMIHTNKQTR